MNPDKISKFIYQLRTEKNLSQYQLADMIPISRQAVSKWERGQTIPDSDTLLKLSEIFGVTINELLKGERLSNNSVEQLEKTTLTILDESNKKSQTIKRIIRFALIVIVSILLVFLFYYFINSYNSIQVYTVGGKGDHFDLHDGIFITTKQKSYLKMGKLVVPTNDVIKEVKLYYQKDHEERIIFQNKDIDQVIVDMYGYGEYFPQKDIKTIMNNTYLEITYNENEKETLKIRFDRDFVNTDYIFKLQKNGHGKEIIPAVDNIEQEAIKIIKEKGIYSNNSYHMEIEEDSDQVVIHYHEEINQLIMNKNNNLVWTYFLDNNIYTCDDNPENCEKRIQEDLKKYVLDKW